MDDEIYRITEDLMIGDLKIVQDKRLYRFTSDSIVLSRFADCLKSEVVADFCAGSGIVGLHYYGLHADRVKTVDLFELQPELCEIARKSIEINGLQDKFSLIEGRLQDAPVSLNGKYTLVLCNPPYIRSAVCDELDRTVLQEPRMALCGGEDGLLFYRTLIPYFHAVLPQGARVLFEIGYDQGGLLAFAKRYFPLAELKKDYGGNDRMLILRQTKPKTEQKQT